MGTANFSSHQFTSQIKENVRLDYKDKSCELVRKQNPLLRAEEAGSFALAILFGSPAVMTLRF